MSAGAASAMEHTMTVRQTMSGRSLRHTCCEDTQTWNRRGSFRAAASNPGDTPRTPQLFPFQIDAAMDDSLHVVDLSERLIVPDDPRLEARDVDSPRLERGEDRVDTPLRTDSGA